MLSFSRSELDVGRWYTILTVLGVELARDFYVDMGLPVENYNIFQDIFLQFLQEYSAYIGNGVEQKLVDISRLQLSLMKAFQKLEVVIERGAIEAFYSWGISEFPYYAEEDSQEFLWKFLLRLLAGIDRAETELIPIKLSATKVGLIKKIIQRNMGRISLLEQRIEQARQTQETMDHLCSIIGDPFDWIENVIEYRSFCNTWIELQKRLTCEDRKKFLEWAKEQGKLLNIPVELLKLPVARNLLNAGSQ